jgi:hypothetical protein
MRIRSTKPEFWRSERVAGVSWDARLVLKGLESFVDDNGVGKDDLALIVADVFPRDLSRNPTGTLQKVSEALDHLSSAGLLWRYEVDGTRFLYVAFWESIQRIEKPTRGRFPRPDGTMNYRDSTIRESSGNPPGTLREPSGLEQGNRGTGEQGNQVGLPDSHHARDEDEPPMLETVVPRHLIPADFAPGNVHKAYAGERGINLSHELRQFWLHCKSKRVTSLDWDAEFSKWLGNARLPSSGGSAKGGTSTRVAAHADLVQQFAAEEAAENVVPIRQIEGA